MITSMQNRRVKEVAALLLNRKDRQAEDAYVIEGIRMAKEAPEDHIRGIYVSETFAKEPEKDLWNTCEKLGYEVLADDVFRKLSDTKTPQGILMVMGMPHSGQQDLLKTENPLLLLAEDIQDPGNLGTMLRAGEGAGLTGAIFSKGTVDIFNPKTIRSTMGSIFRIPFCYVEDLPETVRELTEKGLDIYAAHLQGSVSYEQPDYTKGCGFMIGNEGNGLTKEATEAATGAVRIPMLGQVESLNAGVASALLLYEAARQRRS